MKDKRTPLELAKDLIRIDVLRKETIQQIRSGQQGSGGPGYYMSVGGCMNDKKIPTDKIIVIEAQGKEVNKIFSLREIYNLIEKELNQPSLL